MFQFLFRRRREALGFLLSPPLPRLPFWLQLPLRPPQSDSYCFPRQGLAFCCWVFFFSLFCFVYLPALSEQIQFTDENVEKARAVHLLTVTASKGITDDPGSLGEAYAGPV